MIALAVSPLLPTQASARRAQVPLPGVALPATLDWQPEYQGQYLCSDWAKPGALMLSKLLRRTYGRYTTYITRSCATSGISEHEEGRAIDWMVDSEDPNQRAKARAFLAWATAPGPNGERGAMARRLGIMYLIYEDRMWRAYRPEDGWQEYNGCFGSQSEYSDTSCHRDHIHISLSWDGAYGKTSFWTGKAETRPPCESSAASRPNGSPTRPVTLINTDSGLGVRGKHCRLGAGTGYSSRTYSIRVPVPATKSGPPVQRVQLKAFDINAPVGLTIRSAKTITIPQGTKPGGILGIPLARDGVIRFTVGAGYSQLWLRGLGTGSSSTLPPRVGLRAFRSPWLVNFPVTVRGRVLNAPVGATVTILRRLAGGRFTRVVSTPVVGDRYSLSSPLLTTKGTYEYRAVLTQAGAVLSRSPVRGLNVRPTIMTLNQPAPIRAGTKVRLTGGILGAPPAGATLQIQARRPGGRWQTVSRRTTGNGGYRARKRLRVTGAYTLRTRLVSGTRVWARTPFRTVVVR